MIFCTAASSLKFNLANDAAVDGVCSWVDMSSSANPSEDETHVKTGGSAGDYTLAAPPASGVKRVVKSLSIWNVDATDAALITVQKVVTSGTVLHTNVSVTLQPGQGLFYEDGAGWSTTPAQPTTVPSTVSVLLPVLGATANLTSAKTITSNSTFAVYVGKAPRGFSACKVRLRVTTAAATITWAEVAIAKGSVNLGTNPALTVVGWADVSAIVNSTGQKSIDVNVSSSQIVAPNDDLWVLIGNSATTALQVRALSIADDLQVGLQASLATRPSSNVGVAQGYTIEGATTLAAWAALVA
jgi:hypothetical protein